MITIYKTCGKKKNKGAWYYHKKKKLKTVSLLLMLPLYVLALLPAAGCDSGCERSPNGRIAFNSDRNGNWEVYTVKPDGSCSKRLTHYSGSDQFLSWSADGTKIAFYRGSYETKNSPHRGIHIMNADGTNIEKLTGHKIVTAFVAWSPDGKKILFDSRFHYNTTQIYAVSTSGHKVEPVAAALYQVNKGPTWSPDGTKIAFFSSRNKLPWEMYLMNPDGSGQKRLTFDSGLSLGDVDRQLYASWSPDSKKLLFSAGKSGNSNIYVIGADGSGYRQLTDHPGKDYYPAWSPDGSKISFTSNRDGHFHIYTMNADGTEITKITGGDGTFSAATWSPDGKKLAFNMDSAKLLGGRSLQIGVIGVNGQDMDVVAGHGKNVYAVWSHGKSQASEAAR